VCEAAARSFAALGADVDEGHPQLDDPWPIVDAIWCANQAAPYAGRFDDVRERLDQGRVPVIERGLEMAATDLVEAQGAKQRYGAAWDAFMAERCDLMLTPTLPVTAFAAGLDQPGSVAGRMTSYLSWTAFTYPFNVTGQPAASVPCGMLDGLPVALQIIGRRGEDALVLRAAAAFEQAHPWPFPEL
jgi:aspartyl-tRNA(Asn)/glutamyl-tRNA(Gln) amidotransferase subunit A